MGKEIAISVMSEETRAAVLENGVVTDLYIDRAKNRDFVGNIGQREQTTQTVDDSRDVARVLHGRRGRGNLERQHSVLFGGLRGDRRDPDLRRLLGRLPRRAPLDPRRSADSLPRAAPRRWTSWRGPSGTIH